MYVVIRGSESGNIVAAGLNYGRGGRRLVSTDAGNERCHATPLGCAGGHPCILPPQRVRRPSMDCPRRWGIELADLDLPSGFCRWSGFAWYLRGGLDDSCWPHSFIAACSPAGAGLVVRSTVCCRRAGLAIGETNRECAGPPSGSLASHLSAAAAEICGSRWPHAMLGQLVGRLAEIAEARTEASPYCCASGGKRGQRDAEPLGIAPCGDRRHASRATGQTAAVTVPHSPLVSRCESRKCGANRF